MELQRYRAVDAVREKWEEQEQRVVDVQDRLRRDNSGWGGVDYTTLSGQQEEEQCAMKEEVHKCEITITVLQGLNEVLTLEREELKAALEHMHAKIRRLKQHSSKGMPGVDSQG